MDLCGSIVFILQRELLFLIISLTHGQVKGIEGMSSMMPEASFGLEFVPRFILQIGLILSNCKVKSGYRSGSKQHADMLSVQSMELLKNCGY